MPSPSVTYTFTNTTTADASEVNQNFTDIINGLTDGTKDFSIGALTAAGAATFNGNVTLGNATSDDVTVTGSLASSIPVKTTFSYDIGSATIGLRSVYLGSNDSAARSVRVIAGAVASSYTLTLPTSGGTTRHVLKTDGSGGTSFENRTVLYSQAKTTTYTATTDDDILLCSTSGGAWTLTLPAAASSTGKTLYIKKTTLDSNLLTIDGNGAETIDGAATYGVALQYESVRIHCDGSNWHVIDKFIPPVSVYAIASGDTSIANGGTPTRIQLDSVVRDVYSTVTTGASWVFTAPRAGEYTFNLQATYGNSEAWTAGASVYLLPYTNGSQTNGATIHTPITGATVRLGTLKLSITLLLAKTDTVDFRSLHGESAARAITDNSLTNGETYVSITSNF